MPRKSVPLRGRPMNVGNWRLRDLVDVETAITIIGCSRRTLMRELYERGSLQFVIKNGKSLLHRAQVTEWGAAWREVYLPSSPNPRDPAMRKKAPRKVDE